jgi:alpha-galactosidase
MTPASHEDGRGEERRHAVLRAGTAASCTTHTYPWFIKHGRPDLIERYGIPIDEYLRRCEGEIAMWETLQAHMDDPDAAIDDPSPAMLEAARKMLEDTVIPADFVREIFEPRPSGEYAPRIIRSMETGDPSVIYGNVPNHGLIEPHGDWLPSYH